MKQNGSRPAVLVSFFVLALFAFVASSSSGAPSHVWFCKPTAFDELGPFYKPNAPERARVGQGYILTGAVKSAEDCSPLRGARLEFWLADPNGRYDDDHRATVYSDENGKYRLECNFPPPYDGRPPHIHVRATAKLFRPLVTQHYPVTGNEEGILDLVLIPLK